MYSKYEQTNLFFRVISMLLSFYKIFKKVQVGISTNDAISRLYRSNSQIHMHIDDERLAISVFLDLSKASNSLDHGLLFKGSTISSQTISTYLIDCL